LEDLVVVSFVFLACFPLAPVPSFLFLANAALPALVLVLSGIGLWTGWLDRMKDGSGRGPRGWDSELSNVSCVRKSAS
jgi:hypothetical protein